MNTLSFKTYLAIITLFAVVMSCNQEDHKVSNLKNCDLENPIKSLSEIEGMIWYDSLTQQYSIFSGIDGSYDLQDIGIPCNLPENFHKQGLKISFDGSYYKCEEFTSHIPGQTYYYLEITKIETTNN